MSVISALKRLKMADLCQFKVSQSYIVRPCLERERDRGCGGERLDQCLFLVSVGKNTKGWVTQSFGPHLDPWWPSCSWSGSVWWTPMKIKKFQSGICYIQHSFFVCLFVFIAQRCACHPCWDLRKLDLWKAVFILMKLLWPVSAGSMKLSSSLRHDIWQINMRGMPGTML